MKFHPNLFWNQQDITQLPVQVIVNAANKDLKNGGGVCGAIHRACPTLEARCIEVRKRRRKSVPTGSNVITVVPSFGGKSWPSGDKNFIAAVIHAVGPVYHEYADMPQAAEMLLAKTYEGIMEKMASRNYYSSIAIPAISCGIYGFPIPKACEIAITTVSHCLYRYCALWNTRVYLVAFDKTVKDFYKEAGIPEIMFVDGKIAGAVYKGVDYPNGLIH